MQAIWGVKKFNYFWWKAFNHFMNDVNWGKVLSYSLSALVPVLTLLLSLSVSSPEPIWDQCLPFASAPFQSCLCCLDQTRHRSWATCCPTPNLGHPLPVRACGRRNMLPRFYQQTSPHASGFMSSEFADDLSKFQNCTLHLFEASQAILPSILKGGGAMVDQERYQFQLSTIR